MSGPANSIAKHPSRRAELKRAMLEFCMPRNVGANPRLVYCALWSYANQDGLAWPGGEALMNWTGLSESGLRKATRELEVAQIVRSVRAAKGGERIKVGITALNPSRALYLLWPIATGQGKATFARWIAPHAHVSEPMSRLWRVRVDGGDGIAGLVTTAVLLEHLRTRRVPPTAMVWTEGMRWTSALDVPVLAPACAWPLAG